MRLLALLVACILLIIGGCEHKPVEERGEDGLQYELRFGGAGGQSSNIVLYCMRDGKEAVVDRRGLDHPKVWVPIVRREGDVRSDALQLYRAPHGLLVGLAEDNECYLVYDTRSQSPIPVDKAVSPLILHDESSKPYWPDVEMICAMATTRWRPVNGFPDLDHLREYTRHENPYLRRAAAQMLEAWDEGGQ